MKGRVIETEADRDREIFYVLLHSLSVPSGQGWGPGPERGFPALGPSSAAPEGCYQEAGSEAEQPGLESGTVIRDMDCGQPK